MCLSTDEYRCNFLWLFFILDPGHSKFKPKLISSRRVFIYRNKKIGKCEKSSRELRCFFRKRCVKRHRYHRRRCIRFHVKKICVYKHKKMCKFCTKWFWRRCYRIRRKYKYITKCDSSRRYQVCARRTTKRYNKNVVVKKYYLNRS